MLNDDHLDQLRDAMMDYIDAHGLPTEREALEWFQSAAREETSVFDAFAPMFDTYSNGLGFTTDEWMNMTYNIDISISTSIGGGVYVYFDFDFESEDGNYVGSRGGRGHI